MAKVLIVDDSLDLLSILPTLLKHYDFEAETASTKKEAMDLLAKSKPDIIILDVNLCCDDGRDVCKELKASEDYKYIPILLFSANPDNLTGYELCNADGVMEKPFDIKIMVSKINLVLDKKIWVA